jgi:hypothetical protein
MPDCPREMGGGYFETGLLQTLGLLRGRKASVFPPARPSSSTPGLSSCKDLSAQSAVSRAARLLVRFEANNPTLCALSADRSLQEDRLGIGSRIIGWAVHTLWRMAGEAAG